MTSEILIHVKYVCLVHMYIVCFICLTLYSFWDFDRWVIKLVLQLQWSPVCQCWGCEVQFNLLQGAFNSNINWIGFKRYLTVVILFRLIETVEPVPIMDRIKAFQKDPEKMEVDQVVKPLKARPVSKAFDLFESRGIMIGQVYYKLYTKKKIYITISLRVRDWIFIHREWKSFKI